jgi:outer membrane protein OmpA-like peptidoglycan-associated protein
MSYLTNTLRAQVIMTAVMACTHAHAQSPVRQTQAEAAYSSLRYSDAARYFKDEYRKASDPEKRTAISARIADCYWLMRNYDSAYQWYAALPAQTFQADSKARSRMSDLLATRGQYDQAAKVLDGLNGYAQKAEGFRNTRALKSDSVDWNLQFLESVNTPQFREFSPVLTDGGLVWSTNLPIKGGNKGVMGWDNQGYSKLMLASDRNALTAGPVQSAYSQYQTSVTSSSKRLAENYDLADFERARSVTIPANMKEQVSKILKLASPVNMVGGLSYNQAHASYHAANGQLFFSANRQEKLKAKTRTVGIASASLQSAVANDVKFIFADGSDHSLMHPAIHADGSTLVFASDKQGGAGGFDLYVSTRSSEGAWSDPRALTALNTAGNELFPTFGQNGKLYFSTDGRAGLGCLDIYVADFVSGTARNVSHLSYPINSAYDDFGMAMSQDGKYGYFTSDRLGSDDIFKFSFEEKKVKVSGTVKSEQSNAGKPGVEVVLEAKTPSAEFQQASVTKTDAKGEFTFQLKPGKEYRVNYSDGGKKVSKVINGDLTKKSAMQLEDMIIHDVSPPAPPISQTAEPVVTPNPTSFKVNFDFNSFQVRTADQALLAKVKDILAVEASKICYLTGHTDASGSTSYNLELSRKRVNAVRDHLISLGLREDRIKNDHFGSSKLIQITDDRAEAEVNRRVDIALIEGK